VNREKDVREWVEYAEADRLSARNAFNAADYRDAAFHCQQAIEKLLKAAIVAQTGRRPPYAHNLWKLAQAVEGLTIPTEIADKMASINHTISSLAIQLACGRVIPENSLQNSFRKCKRCTNGLWKS